MSVTGRVLIIDKTNEPRGKANCNAFHATSCAAYLYDGIRCREAPRFLMDIGAPSGEFMVVMLHDNDADILAPLAITYSCLLRYTGGEPPHGGENWVLARAVKDPTTAVTTSEAKEICDWVREGGPRDAASLPALLRRDEALLLPALAILCQGYLAVYAKHGEVVSGGAVFKALASIGWDGEKHSALVRGDLSTVTGPHWWLDAFGIGYEKDDDGRERAARNDWEGFTGLLTSEWGKPVLPDALRTILDNLGACRPISSAALVAEVYSEIDRRSRGTSTQA